MYVYGVCMLCVSRGVKTLDCWIVEDIFLFFFFLFIYSCVVGRLAVSPHLAPLYHILDHRYYIYCVCCMLYVSHVSSLLLLLLLPCTAVLLYLYYSTATSIYPLLRAHSSPARRAPPGHCYGLAARQSFACAGVPRRHQRRHGCECACCEDDLGASFC
jgi:hypothetical protein